MMVAIWRQTFSNTSPSLEINLLYFHQISYSKYLTARKSTLVAAMAWCYQAARFRLNQWWTRFAIPYVVTWPNRMGIMFRGTLLSQLLSHWGWDNMADIFQTIISNAFSRMKTFEFWKQWYCIGSDNGLTPNRRQAIIRTNGELDYWRIYFSLGLNKLFTCPLWTFEWVYVMSSSSYYFLKYRNNDERGGCTSYIFR